MSNIESDSSDFWNLGKKSNNLKSDSESSDFWNLSKKKHSKYSSESFSSETDETEEVKNNKKAEVKAEVKAEEKVKVKVEVKAEVKADETTKKINPTNNESIVTSESSPGKGINETKQNDLIPVKIDNKKSDLPPNKITYKNKNIGDFTIKEFYNNFMKTIIDIINSLKKGKGLHEIFKDKDRLIYFGIAIIIICILLVPLVFN